MLIDSHAHLDFYDDLDPVLAAASAAGLGAILAIGIGDGPATMHRALEIAHTRSTPALRVFATAGIHPQQADQATPEWLARLAALTQDAHCLAVGEIGLDYYHLENPDSDIQQQAFLAQMEIAAAARKPIILHCRTSELATPQAKARFGTAEASTDMLSMLERYWAPTGLPFLLHCFSGTKAEAKRALVTGGYLSFAGNLTYPAAKHIREAALFSPSERILVETDAPFLAPIPYRGKRNEPAFVTHTAAFLAALRGVSSDELSALTTANFERLFALPSI